MRQCARCGASAPLHRYPVGDIAQEICTNCWQVVTQRGWHHQPPINPAQKFIPGLPGVQPRLI